MNFEEKTRNFQGLWISKILWFNQELSIQEKMFLVEINSLDNEKYCYASNSYFSEFFQLSCNRCSEIIKGLEKKELIKITYIREKKAIKSRTIEVLEKGNRVLGKPNRVLGKQDRGIRNIEGGYSEKGEDRSISLRSNNNRSNNKEEESQAKELASLLLSESRKEDPKLRIGKDQETINSWSIDIEKLIRIDKRSFSEVSDVIKWCKEDGNFWSPNILSGKKLREKFPTLFAQMNKKDSTATKKNWTTYSGLDPSKY